MSSPLSPAFAPGAAQKRNSALMDFVCACVAFNTGAGDAGGVLVRAFAVCLYRTYDFFTASWFIGESL
jgi:hypothetical protein